MSRRVFCILAFEKIGRHGRGRTDDIYHVKVALSH